MAKCNGIAAGNLAHSRLAVCRRQNHDQSKQACAGDVEHPTGKAADVQDDGEHSCHVESVVAGEEDIVKARKTCEDNVQDHADAHDDCGCLTKLAKCERNDGLVVWNDTLHVKGEVEDLAKGKKGTGLQETRACRKNEEADDGLEGALDEILNWLSLKRQTQQGNKAN